tara:strand:+ start:38 stop:649 length:612 start_codon:yes stop_codon:yes gene_type:complete
MKKTRTKVDEDNISIGCPHCCNWEEQPVDQQRHHLQSFLMGELLDDEEGKQVSQMQCLDCEEQFKLVWDYDEYNETKLKASNAIKWVDGLLKTRVKQGTGSLGHPVAGFCCLGYGCSLLSIDYLPSDGTSYDFSKSVGLMDISGGFMEEIVWDGDISASSLVNLNDDLKYSFNKISKFIKGNIEELFEDDVAKILKAHYNASN